MALTSTPRARSRITSRLVAVGNHGEGRVRLLADHPCACALEQSSLGIRSRALARRDHRPAAQSNEDRQAVRGGSSSRAS